MRVSPTHSSKPGTLVYHNNNQCWDRNNIEQRYLTKGDGGLRLCATCKDLNAQGK